MNEYISREETVKAFCEKCKGYYDGHCIHRGECDVDVIKTAPAADVQPVKHGRWINENFCTRCSACGHMTIYDKYSREVESDYCPNCGARMDGDRDD